MSSLIRFNNIFSYKTGYKISYKITAIPPKNGMTAIG